MLAMPVALSGLRSIHRLSRSRHISTNTLTAESGQRPSGRVTECLPSCITTDHNTRPINSGAPLLKPNTAVAGRVLTLQSSGK